MPADYVRGFVVREPAWHGLATILSEYPGRDEAMAAAGHDFTIVERPLEVVGNKSNRKAKDWKALLKSGTGDLFACVKDSYTVVQNDVPWDICDALVNLPKVHYEAGGIIRDGAVCYVLAWLDEPGQVKGDDSEVYPFVVVSWAHDGSASIKADATSVRVVCSNTYDAALTQSARSGRSFTFRHTAKVHDRIEDAKLAMRGVSAAHSAFMELANELADVKLSESQRELFISEFIPMPPEGIISERVVSNVDKARGHVRKIFESATIPEAHRFTAYGAVSAGVEYLDHVRGWRNSDTYLGRSILRPEPLKSKLVSLARECAKA